jgi:hypothetical protein
VTGSGTLSAIDVSDNDDIDVELVFTHFGGCFLFLCMEI